MSSTHTGMKLLSEVTASQIRKHNGCGKLQWTAYGQCLECPDNDDCRKCYCVLNGISEIELREQRYDMKHLSTCPQCGQMSLESGNNEEPFCSECGYPAYEQAADERGE